MLIDTERIEAILERSRLFHGLPAAELGKLAEVLHPHVAPAGIVLFREGEPGDYLLIIGEGQVEIVKALDAPEERVMALRGPGEIIGEMSLFALDGVRSASVRTTCPSLLLELRQVDFQGLLERQPRLANEIVRVLGERLTSHENQSVRELTEINLQLRAAYESLKAAQAELVEKEKLERELELARQIQLSVLPDVPPVYRGCELAARIQPARAVGGDFYDFIPLSHGRLGVVIGDVTDKGMPAAIFMAQTYALLHAEASRNSSPQRALQRVNQYLLGMNARGLFATILYGILDTHTRQFSYARAGHEMPILYLPDRGARLLPHTDGQPVGILEDPVFDEATVRLGPGGALLLYTDGVSDQINPDGERFGVERLVETFARYPGPSADAICDGLLHALDEYRGGAPRFDDVTLVAIKIEA